jgi:hypothetical protein
MIATQQRLAGKLNVRLKGKSRIANPEEVNGVVPSLFRRFGDFARLPCCFACHKP